MELAVFAIFGALAVVSALVVVIHRDPVYSVMSLVVTLFCLAVLFVMLGAPFLAALLILVYTGAILVLFLFVLMLLNIGRSSGGLTGGAGQRWGAVLASVAFAGLLLGLFWRAHGTSPTTPLLEAAVELKPLAWTLLTTYLLPFELVGLLLLAAVIGATVLARRSRPEAGG